MPDVEHLTIYDQTRPLRVKRGAAGVATLLLVGMIIDGMALHFLPGLILDTFWIGRPDHQTPNGFLLALGSIGFCIVPFCSYFGAVKENKFCLLFGGTCTWMLCTGLVCALIPMLHLISAVPAMEHGFTEMETYYVDCDPHVCCEVAVTELTPGVTQQTACDTETGLPFVQYEKAYLDCVLGSDPDYVRNSQVNPRHVYLASEPPQDFACKWSVLYLTECEGRNDGEFKVYANNWAYDMKDALNSSLAEENLTLIPPILLGAEGEQTPWKRVPVPAGWEPGMPLPGNVNMTDATTSRRVAAEESETEAVEEEVVDDAEKDVELDAKDWEKFGDDLEKFNWTKLSDNPKNPGLFKFKHLFKSDLDKCKYRPEALEDAHTAPQEAVPQLKLALSLYIVATFLVVLFGICITTYSCVATFHFCCCGKREPDYYGV
jgi:hypothetical protein